MSKESSGMGFVSILQLGFIGCKIAHVVDWSWWLVWSPFLAVTGFVVALFMFVALVAAVNA